MQNCRITCITVLLQCLFHPNLHNYRHYSVVTVPVTSETTEVQVLQRCYSAYFMQNCRSTGITAVLQCLFHAKQQK